MKNYFTLLLITGALFSGCAKQPEQKPICPANSKYSEIHNKCLVLNSRLNGVIKTKDCNNSKCIASVMDERGHSIMITPTENQNVGDIVELVVYKNGLKAETK